MKQFLKIVASAAIATAAMAQQASAKICLLGLCLPIGGGGGSSPPPSSPPPTHPGAPGVPEIDASQGAAALVILAVAVLLLREAFLRQRQTI